MKVLTTYFFCFVVFFKRVPELSSSSWSFCLYHIKKKKKKKNNKGHTEGLAAASDFSCLDPLSVWVTYRGLDFIQMGEKFSLKYLT